MLVATWSGSLLPWEQELSAFKLQLRSAFGRAELRRSAGAFIDGLLSGVARKTGWQLAEQVGLERPYRLQSLLGRSSWQADTLRDLVQANVLATLGDAGGVLVVDETGFLKKGTHSVASLGSIPARLGGWRTARSAYSSPMLAGSVRR
jgi:SRSO17 transposase